MCEGTHRTSSAFAPPTEAPKENPGTPTTPTVCKPEKSPNVGLQHTSLQCLAHAPTCSSGLSFAARLAGLGHKSFQSILHLERNELYGKASERLGQVENALHPTRLKVWTGHAAEHEAFRHSAIGALLLVEPPPTREGRL